MPNWSFCQFKIYGEKKHLKNLTSILKRLEKRKTSPIPNDFGNLWWGNIVHLLGDVIGSIWMLFNFKKIFLIMFGVTQDMNDA